MIDTIRPVVTSVSKNLNSQWFKFLTNQNCLTHVDQASTTSFILDCVIRVSIFLVSQIPSYTELALKHSQVVLKPNAQGKQSAELILLFAETPFFMIIYEHFVRGWEGWVLLQEMFF